MIIFSLFSVVFAKKISKIQNINYIIAHCQNAGRRDATPTIMPKFINTRSLLMIRSNLERGMILGEYANIYVATVFGLRSVCDVAVKVDGPVL